MSIQITHPQMSAARAALAGAVLVGLLCILFWATAAAGGLPPSAPESLRQFTPAYGIRRLFTGLFWAMGIAAVVSLLLFGLYEAARRVMRHDHG